MVEVASSSLVVRSIFWRHSQAVRQRTATPSPPVRFWVTPPKTGRSFMICRFFLFCSAFRSAATERKNTSWLQIPSHLKSPFAIFGMVFQLSFITVGKTGLGAFLSVLGRAVNIVPAGFSWAFLGLSGVAIAAGIGYAVPQLVWIVWGYVNRKVLRVVRPKWRLRTILDSCINGSSEKVSMLAFSIGIGCSDGMASLSIIWYAQGLFGRLFRGYINGASPVVSYHFGRDDKRRLSRLSRISLVTLTVTAAVVTALSYFLVELSFIFAKGSIAVAKIALHGFRIVATSFLMMAINVFTSGWFTP